MHEVPSVSVCFCVGPRRVEELQVVNVSSSQVWLSWLVQAGRHAAVSRVLVSLSPSGGSETRTAVLNTSTTEYTFRSGSALEHLNFQLLQQPLCPLKGAVVLNLKWLWVIYIWTTRGHCFISLTKLSAVTWERWGQISFVHCSIFMCTSLCFPVHYLLVRCTQWMCWLRVE